MCSQNQSQKSPSRPHDPKAELLRIHKIDTKTFDCVMSALKLQKTLRFEYQPLQKTTFLERELDPYHIICQRGNWYVIGFCHLKNGVRIFSLSRMKNAKILEEQEAKFKKPADFDAKNYIDLAMGVWASAKVPYKVKLLFDSSIGTYASEHIWHEGQESVLNDDGSVEISFETTQIPEVLRWVLGQGSTVKVLEPPELIDLVKAELEKARKLY